MNCFLYLPLVASIIQKMPFDKQITLTPEQFRDLGMRDKSQAQKNLELISVRLGPVAAGALVPSLLHDLPAAADPDMALNNLERFVSSLADASRFTTLITERPAILGQLVAVFGASRFLSAFLIAQADYDLAGLAEDGYLARPAGRNALSVRLAAMTGGEPDEKAFFRSMRVFRKREMLRIGLRDLLGRADLRETTEDLSDLAEVCLQHAYEWADAV
jgi:glutamate-ammonia-ligase adenylyltransferase